MLGKIKIRLLIFLIGVLVSQMTLVPYVAIKGMKPDLCTALFLALLMVYPHANAVLIALFIGTIKELFSAYVFGIEIFSLVIPSFIVPLLVGKIDVSNYFMRIAVFFVGAWIYFISYSVFFVISTNRYDMCTYYALYSLLSALYTCFFAHIFYFVVQKYIPRKTEQYELF